MFNANSRLNKNEWISDPRVPDPENLPIPLGWTLIIRPYPIQEKTKGGILLINDTIDFTHYLTNVGRIVAMGPCVWNKPEHKDKDGNKFNWAEVGDFVSYGSHVGVKRKFKGVSYLVLVDDEIVEVLRDPLVYENSGLPYTMDIPEEHLKKYNTIHNPKFSKKKAV